MTDWSEIGVGDVVRGARDGKPWEVLAIDGPDYTIGNNGKSFTVRPSGPVELIATAGEILAAATASVKINLPGSMTIAVKADSLWTCPWTYPDAASLLSHLFVMHGKKIEERDIYDMLNEHIQMHKSSSILHPHVHSRDFYKENS